MPLAVHVQMHAHRVHEHVLKCILRYSVRMCMRECAHTYASSLQAYTLQQMCLMVFVSTVSRQNTRCTHLQTVPGGAGGAAGSSWSGWSTMVTFTSNEHHGDLYKQRAPWWTLQATSTMVIFTSKHHGDLNEQAPWWTSQASTMVTLTRKHVKHSQKAKPKWSSCGAAWQSLAQKGPASMVNFGEIESA